MSSCGLGSIRLQPVPLKCRTAGPEKGAPKIVLAVPTAQTSLPASAETALRLTPVKAGLETMLQLVPSQCTTPALPPFSPTTQTSLVAWAEIAATPTLAKAGSETTLQLMPSQCSTSGPPVELLLWLTPTAQTSLLAAPATAWS